MNFRFHADQVGSNRREIKQIGTSTMLKGEVSKKCEDEELNALSEK